MHEEITGIGRLQSDSIENLEQGFKAQQDAVSSVAEKSAPKPIFIKSPSNLITAPYDMYLLMKLGNLLIFREPKKRALEIEEVPIEEMDLPD